MILSLASVPINFMIEVVQEIGKTACAVPANGTGWLEAATAIGTVLAAAFAALSAWTSKKTAKAASEAVEEARLARRNELAPRLVLEKDFLDLFLCMHEDLTETQPTSCCNVP